jgi:hypothetical protein
MSFDCITEGSKDYIKYVLQLSEESMTGVTYVAPGRKKETRKRPSFTFSGGAGGKGLGGGDDIQPGDFLSTEKDEKGKIKDQGLRGGIMWGNSKIPNSRTTNEKGEEQDNTQGGLDYITSLGQAQSALDFADQMMPAAVKLLLAKGLFSSQIKANPGSTAGTAGSSNVSLKGALDAARGGANQEQQMALSGFEAVAGDVLSQIENLTGTTKIANENNPLAQKVMQYSKNLGAIDPYNPLLGLKIGVEMLGGKEVLRRTRELGAVQSAGAASSMGHPSGFRGY